MQKHGLLAGNLQTQANLVCLISDVAKEQAQQPYVETDQQPSVAAQSKQKLYAASSDGP